MNDEEARAVVALAYGNAMSCLMLIGPLMDLLVRKAALSADERDLLLDQAILTLEQSREEAPSALKPGIDVARKRLETLLNP